MKTVFTSFLNELVGDICEDRFYVLFEVHENTCNVIVMLYLQSLVL